MRLQKRTLWDILLTSFILVGTFVLLNWKHVGSSIAAVPLPPQNELVSLPDDVPLPSVDLEVLSDPEKGWNAHLLLDGFTQLPWEEPKEGVLSGYISASVDGGPRTRLYAPWLHLPVLSEGSHTIQIALHTEDFRMFADEDGVAFMRQFSVSVKGKDAYVGKL